MKNLILYISLPILVLGTFLFIATIQEYHSVYKVSPYLAIWVLLQGFYFLYLGRKMMLDLADYRIAAVVLFLFGQIIMWYNWEQASENQQIGFAIGVLIVAIGFFWGTIDHYTKQEILGTKNRSG